MSKTKSSKSQGPKRSKSAISLTPMWSHRKPRAKPSKSTRSHRSTRSTRSTRTVGSYWTAQEVAHAQHVQQAECERVSRLQDGLLVLIDQRLTEASRLQAERESENQRRMIAMVAEFTHHKLPGDSERLMQIIRDHNAVINRLLDLAGSQASKSGDKASEVMDETPPTPPAPPTEETEANSQPESTNAVPPGESSR